MPVMLPVSWDTIRLTLDVLAATVWVGGQFKGSPLHHAYQQAITVTWLGIVACQAGPAFAARTDRASLRTAGLLSNKYLLGGVTVALTFAAALIYLPALHGLFGTAALSPAQLVTVAPFPFAVWAPTTRAGSRPGGVPRQAGRWPGSPRSAGISKKHGAGKL